MNVFFWQFVSLTLQIYPKIPKLPNKNATIFHLLLSFVHYVSEC